jgi:hypothetical protein
MKIKYLFPVIVMVCSFTRVMAQCPIPSYNVDLTEKASFQEQRNSSTPIAIVLDKRQVNIKGHVPNFPSGTPCAQVWVYSFVRPYK